MPTEIIKRSEIKLKPCPFCGSKVSMTYNSADNTFNFWHKGTSCVLVEPIRIDGMFVKSLAEAAEAWNRRAKECEAIKQSFEKHTDMTRRTDALNVGIA